MALSCCKKYIFPILKNNIKAFLYLNCFDSFRTENKLKIHVKITIIANHKIILKMPEKGKIILKYNHGEKFVKVPFIIYADTESLLEKIDICQSNPEKSSTTKINKLSSGDLLFTHCSFDNTKNKQNYYRRRDYMKNFCKDPKEHATKIIHYEKKK